MIVSVLSLQIGRIAKGGPVFSILPEKNKEESMEETQNTGNESAKGDSLTNAMPDIAETIEKDKIKENTRKYFYSITPVRRAHYFGKPDTAALYNGGRGHCGSV